MSFTPAPPLRYPEGEAFGGLSRALSFTPWQFLCPGDPTVGFADSSPGSGAASRGDLARLLESLPRSASPFGGSTQCAHWGIGSPWPEYCRWAKDREGLNLALSFPPWQFLCPGDPTVGFAASVSLRLGHGAALTCHRHVIHSRAAASLPKRGAASRGGSGSCFLTSNHPRRSSSFCQTAAQASLGMRQSPRGDSVTLPTFGPSGRQLRLNCWTKKRR